MSHGADTEDFEQALGMPLPRPSGRTFIDTPVMFLGIEPGGTNANGEYLQHPLLLSVNKWVPTKHYYWTAPPSVGWPTTASLVTWVPGPFFAHLLCRFGLCNAYFTNIVKCRLWDNQRQNKQGQSPGGEVDIKPDKRRRLADSRIRRNCIEKYLQQEVQIHQPAVIFVFGSRGMRILRDEPWLDQGLLVQLEHYAVVNRNLKTAQKYASQCGLIVHNELVRRGII
jgi:hypothetical protein